MITGAGPGIMQAGAEGAGPERAIGISIQLPFEEAPSDILAGGERLVAMKYFFTRKLMLIKESSAFVCLPGGFGTQDETFELLTLLQTGQGGPGAGRAARRARAAATGPGGSTTSTTELVRAGLISEQDHELFLVTDDVDQAVSCDPALLAQLPLDPLGRRPARDPPAARAHRRARSPTSTSGFADLLVDGRIERTDPLPAEVADRDNLDLARLVMRFDARRAARLRGLIDALNDLPSADASARRPADGSPPAPP